MQAAALTAVTVANMGLANAQRAVDAAAAVSSTCARQLALPRACPRLKRTRFTPLLPPPPQALNIAKSLSKAVDFDRPFSIISLKVSASLGLAEGSDMDVRVNCVVNGKRVVASFAGAFPAEASDIGDKLSAWVRDWFDNNILNPLGANFLASKLGLGQL